MLLCTGVKSVGSGNGRQQSSVFALCLVLSLVLSLALSLGPPEVLLEAPVLTPVVTAWAGGTGDDVQERHGSCGGSTCPSPRD